MDKCIIIPDSFKGTLHSDEVCDVISNAVKLKYPDCNAVSIPVADGGEGTVDCFLASMEGEKVQVTIKDAFGKDICGFYGKFGETAVIEMAAAAGIVSNDKLNPVIASTFGVGQIIRHAVENNCTEVILGLGGSCTNDAGAGMAAALGTVFYNANNESFVPVGGTLSDIRSIDNSKTEQVLSGTNICCMCDIDNVLYGKNGAAYVFAPQKGADAVTVDLLDQNLKAFSDIIEKEMNIKVSHLVGGGAAGGMGAGAYAFLGAKLTRGIELVLDAVGFDRLLKDCDYVFTGEGRFDSQSFSGKVVVGVAKRAKMKNVPVIAIAGSAERGIDDKLIKEIGISRLFVTTEEEQPMESLKKNARRNLEHTVNEIMKIL